MKYGPTPFFENNLMSTRIGAVSYLNTKPLIYGLQSQLPDCELTLDLPSRLADQLSAGELDVALIPSVEYLRGGDELQIVSDACIACRGPVRSVQLLFRCDPKQVTTLALDEGSRTSAALAQVLLHQRYNLRPQLVPLPIEADYEECDADAILVIGDRAMNINGNPYVQRWDLGQQWFQLTGLPFVFAMWVARTGDSLSWDVNRTCQALEVSRDLGLKHLEQIAAQQAARYGLTVDDCLTYFKAQLHFCISAPERAGLELFRKQADKLGLLAASPYSGIA
jgi:chorismate dehydratase